MLFLNQKRIKKSIKDESVFYGISKYINVFVTILTNSILARVLIPSEFGVVSIVTVFTALFAILSDMGLGTAVIQNKSLTDDEVNDIFSFSVYVALLLGGVFLWLGIPISALYKDKIYIKICVLLSFSVFFSAANIIPNALLMKKKRFVLVGRRLIAVSVVTGVIAIVMALAGFSYYSIIFQSIFQALFIFVWNYHNTRLKFQPRFKWNSIRKVQQYSSFQFFYSLINYFARNLDNLLVGKVMGGVNLAYYDKGYRLMMYPVQNLTYVINPILHPILSDHQNNREYIWGVYLRVIRILSLLGVFISFLCFWASEEIILIFFGEQWTGSVPVFRLLSLSVWPQMVSTSAGAIYQSIGNTKLMFKSGAIHFSMTIALIICGVLLGKLECVALLVTVSLYLRFFIDYYFLVVKGFCYSYFEFLASFRPDAIIMSAIVCAIMVGEKIPCSGILQTVIMKTFLLGIVFIVSTIFTGQWSNLVAFVARKNNDENYSK